MNLLTHTNIQSFEYILNYIFFFYLLNVSINYNRITEKTILKKQKEFEKLKQELELLNETRRNLKAQLEDVEYSSDLHRGEEPGLSVEPIQEQLNSEQPVIQEIQIENDTDTDVDNTSTHDSFESETKTLGENTISELRQMIMEYKYMSQELSQLEMENTEIVHLLEQSSKRKLELLFQLSIRKKEIKG
ncbi:hypothetical protein HDV01_005528 [Terramyces sp. JEL0728]|nr:hypothetical protein HDV01_005528 [Terramyces sp. JEL0728]